MLFNYLSETFLRSNFLRTESSELKIVTVEAAFTHSISTCDFELSSIVAPTLQNIPDVAKVLKYQTKKIKNNPMCHYFRQIETLFFGAQQLFSTFNG